MLTINFSSATSTTTGVPLIFTKGISTNNNLIIDGTSIEVHEPGLYEVVGSIDVSSSGAGTYGAAIYADDELQGIQSLKKASASGEVVTTPLYAVIDVKKGSDNKFVKITFLPLGEPVVTDGYVSIKKIV